MPTLKPEFFAVCAQVIPVLFLALIVEDRLRYDKEEATERVMRSWGLALLTIALITSLAVVGGATPASGLAGHVVVTTLLACVGLISIPPIVKEIREGRRMSEGIGHLLAAVAAVLVALWVTFNYWVD
ncbi:hypothetical protein ACK8HX_00040 [Oryzobacter sp. R7]|uniref:hypothetical protein n=1 Tax=Oryzobacter faecalis TaxID=3388656 RepID=UPI00398CA1B6